MAAPYKWVEAAFEIFKRYVPDPETRSQMLKELREVPNGNVSVQTTMNRLLAEHRKDQEGT